MIQRVCASPTWITEGVHVGWTDDLLRAADVIVWLDYVSWSRAARRIVVRFVRSAVDEVRRQRGARKFTRFRSYGHQLRMLVSALRETRHYYQERDGDPSPRERAAANETRAETARHLEPYGDKVVHCRSASDVSAFLRALASASGARDRNGRR